MKAEVSKEAEAEAEAEKPSAPASTSSSGWGFSSLAKQFEAAASKHFEAAANEFKTMKEKSSRHLEAAANEIKSIKENINIDKMSMPLKGEDINNAAAKLEKTGSQFFQKAMNVIDLDKLQQSQDKVNSDSNNKNSIPIPPHVAYLGRVIFCTQFPDLEQLSTYLNQRHQDKYWIINLSEKTYSHDQFQGQVTDYTFPGHPSPPLGLLFKICNSLESWLNSDAENVVVVHCMTGKGRTITLLSCLFAWAQVDWGEDIQDADEIDAEFLCKLRRLSLNSALLPSQKRYLGYFSNIMDGIRPRAEPVMLKRVIVNKGVADIMSTQDKEKYNLSGCRPYLQLYKDGKMLFTTIWQDAQLSNGTRIYSCSGNNKGEGEGIENPYDSICDDSFSFSDIDCILDGDILLRCRHIDSTSGKGVSMFRVAFYTGFVPAGEVLRLYKADLDGLVGDERFDKDMFVDLVFAPVNTKAGYDSGADEKAAEGVEVRAEDETAFNALVSSNASFWEEISNRKVRRRQNRKLKQAKRKAEKLQNQVRKNEDQSEVQKQVIEKNFSILDDDDEYAVNDDSDLKEFHKDDESWREELLALSFSGEKDTGTPPKGSMESIENTGSSVVENECAEEVNMTQRKSTETMNDETLEEFVDLLRENEKENEIKGDELDESDELESLERELGLIN